MRDHDHRQVPGAQAGPAHAQKATAGPLNIPLSPGRGVCGVFASDLRLWHSGCARSKFKFTTELVGASSTFTAAEVVVVEKIVTGAQLRIRVLFVFRVFGCAS